MTWPPETKEDYGRIKGFGVYGSDGEKLGIVDQVMHPDFPDFEQARGNYVFVIKTGLLAKTVGLGMLSPNIYVPEEAVQEADNGRLVLNMTASEFHEDQYSQLPSGPYVFR